MRIFGQNETQKIKLLNTFGVFLHVNLPANRKRNAIENRILKQNRFDTNSDVVLTFLLVSRLRTRCIPKHWTQRQDNAPAPKSKRIT